MDVYVLAWYSFICEFLIQHESYTRKDCFNVWFAPLEFFLNMQCRNLYTTVMFSFRQNFFCEIYFPFDNVNRTLVQLYIAEYTWNDFRPYSIYIVVYNWYDFITCSIHHLVYTWCEYIPNFMCQTYFSHSSISLWEYLSLFLALPLPINFLCNICNNFTINLLILICIFILEMFSYHRFASVSVNHCPCIICYCIAITNLLVLMPSLSSKDRSIRFKGGD